jgi:hypothetical protein
MSDNPYQTPAAPVAMFPAYAAGSPTSALWVDGKHLVVPSGAILPPLCVKSGQPVNEGNSSRKRYIWYPSWLLLLLFVGGLPLVLILYLVTRKECLLTFALHPDVRKRYRNRLIVKALVAMALFGAMVFFAQSDAFVVLIALFLISLLVLAADNSPLRVAKHRDGMFWIRGCSKEFLASIASSVQPSQQPLRPYPY